MKIGLFDSGIGGFSILREIIKVYPSAEFYYISDAAYAPYGEKSDKLILERSIELSEILIENMVDVIVVACNTATAVAINDLRKKFDYIPFVGVEPYLNVQNKVPLLKNVAKLAVITTELTGKSKRFLDLKKKLDPLSNIDLFPSPSLAGLIEKGVKDGFSQNILIGIDNELIKVEKGDYTHLILGCTHYPLISNYIEKKLGIETISPCSFVAAQVKNILEFDINQCESVAKYEIKTFKYLDTSEGDWIDLYIKHVKEIGI